MSSEKQITKRADDFSKWYLDVIKYAELAENSQVRGCMVIKPYGFALWENFKSYLDKRFKETGHVNAYFPLLIPKSFLTKEAEHVEGFAPECAVVTHYRLKDNGKGEMVVDDKAKLKEELIVRPTSETIINDTYSRWVQSYRDLPILINQWSNVLRWEMRTRPFLRTAEFLWQEGHTVHATYEEAKAETIKMLNVYAEFAEEVLAIPVIKGIKSESEKFAGADKTYTIEAMMQDGKALQAGTSHNLGQNFAKAFDIKFQDQDRKIQYVWQTSWGLSTRMVGALIMVHSDDKGLVLPPKIAPIKVVVIPIFKNTEEAKKIKAYLREFLDHVSELDENYEYDDRDYVTVGNKFNEWEKKGIPIRVEVGLKDIEQTKVTIVRRDRNKKEKVGVTEATLYIDRELTVMQKSLYEKAKEFHYKNSYVVDDYDEFKEKIKGGGFVYAHWDGTKETEAKITEETKATIRCIPLDLKNEDGKCVYSNKPSKGRVVFARAY